MQADDDYALMAATVMPDHVHMLIRLTEKLRVGQIAGKFKALTKKALQQADAQWQRNFFEHHLHADEPGNPYAFYIFMNPYRAEFSTKDQTWPHWYCNPEADFEFLYLLKDQKYPQAEWMRLDPEEYGIQKENVGE